LSEQYLEILFKHEEQQAEILIAFLHSLPFQSFWEEDKQTLRSYIREADFIKQDLESLVTSLPFTIEYSIQPLANHNWNSVWESNFSPITVDDFCYIRADFHPIETICQFTLTINPKQSFGTGHHETTFMMIQEMSKLDIVGNRVADLGTGTGVLAILAQKMKAAAVIGTEIDPGALENAMENIKLNNVSAIKITDHSHKFASNSIDITLANIHRNTLIQLGPSILDQTVHNGHILLSGILRSQKEGVLSVYEQLGAELINERSKGDWVMLHLAKLPIV